MIKCKEDRNLNTSQARLRKNRMQPCMDAGMAMHAYDGLEQPLLLCNSKSIKQTHQCSVVRM
eukprot:42912-Eustigmatos_ZCMA.PRE.1